MREKKGKKKERKENKKERGREIQEMKKNKIKEKTNEDKIIREKSTQQEIKEEYK